MGTDYIFRMDSFKPFPIAFVPYLNMPVTAIATAGADVYVGGAFYNAGGITTADRIARWDGAAWNALGPGINNIVYTIEAVGPNVYAGGAFSNAGGNPDANRLARFGEYQVTIYLPLVVR